MREIPPLPPSKMNPWLKLFLVLWFAFIAYMAMFHNDADAGHCHKEFKLSPNSSEYGPNEGRQLNRDTFDWMRNQQRR